jgi:CheY-like chemotaxis protein
MASASKIPMQDSILIVEDQPSNVLIAAAFLEMMGFHCESAGTGYEALKKFAARRYVMIIMDVQMPGIDGLETTRRMRAIEKERNQPPTPILAVTSNATRDDQLFCMRAGMDDYLAKPFGRKELSDKILRLMAHREFMAAE